MNEFVAGLKMNMKKFNLTVAEMAKVGNVAYTTLESWIKEKNIPRNATKTMFLMNFKSGIGRYIAERDKGL